MMRPIPRGRHPLAAGSGRFDATVRSYGAATCLVLAMTALFCRLMTYPLQHDEHFYVSAGVLFTSAGLYSVLGFSHLPNLPILLHLLYAAPIGAHYLLIARLAIFVAWIAAVTALVLIGVKLARDRIAIVVMVALFITNPLLLGAAGMAATNNFMAIPFMLFGLLLFFDGLAPERPRWGVLISSGFCLTLAGGFKINYAVLILPFAVAAFLVPTGLALSSRIRTVVLPLLGGGVAGAAPTLFFLIRDPRGLLAHVVTFHRAPQIAYWRAHPDLADPKIMDFRGNALLAEQLWLSGATMLLVITLIFFMVLFIDRNGGTVKALRAAGWQIWLLLAVTVLAALMAFLPTPSFPQYFILPIPFALVLLAALYGKLTREDRGVARPFLIAATALTCLISIPTLLPATASLLAPRKWTGLQVHADAEQIAELTRTSGPAAALATLGPLYGLEGKQAVYSQLGLGPFVYRAADYIPADQRRYFTALASPTTIIPLLRASCPAALLVGLEGPLDQPLIQFAREANYAPHQITLHAAELKTALLLVRRPTPESPCARRLDLH